MSGLYFKKLYSALLVKHGFELMYRKEANQELDFVLKNNQTVIGIEVSSSMKRPTRGMQEFQKRFRPDRVLPVGSASMPWQDFLKIWPEQLLGITEGQPCGNESQPRFVMLSCADDGMESGLTRRYISRIIRIFKDTIFSIQVTHQ